MKISSVCMAAFRFHRIETTSSALSTASIVFVIKPHARYPKFRKGRARIKADICCAAYSIIIYTVYLHV